MTAEGMRPFVSLQAHGEKRGDIGISEVAMSQMGFAVGTGDLVLPPGWHPSAVNGTLIDTTANTIGDSASARLGGLVIMNGCASGAADDSARQLSRLPGSGRELQVCARRWIGKSAPILLTGAAASKANLEAALTTHPSVLHIAAHFVVPEADGGPAMIALGLTESGELDYLSATEIANLRARLAIKEVSGTHLAGLHEHQFATMPFGETVEGMIAPASEVDLFRFNGQARVRVITVMLTDGMPDKWQVQGTHGDHWGVLDSSAYQADRLNTYFGRRLLEADYVMKRWSLGADRNGDGIPNVLDLGSKTVYGRFWFYPSDRPWFGHRSAGTIRPSRHHVVLFRPQQLTGIPANQPLTNAGNRDPLDVEVLDHGGATLRVRSTLGDVNGDGAVDSTDLDRVRAPSGKPRLLDTTVLDSGSAKLSVSTTVR